MGDYTSELTELLPESTPSASTAGIGINVKRLLKLRGRMMALVFFLIAGSGLATVWMNIPAPYVASAKVEYALKDKIIMAGRDVIDPKTVYDKYVNTEMDKITSHAAITAFIEDTEKRNSVPVLAAMDSGHYGYIRGGLRVTPIPRTGLVAVSFADTDPRSAEQIVDYVIESYMVFNEELTANTGEEILDTLRDQETTILADLEQLYADLEILGEELEMIVRPGVRLGPEGNSPDKDMYIQVSAEWSDARTSMRTKDEVYKSADRVAAGYAKDKSAPIYLDDIEAKIDLDPSVVALAEIYDHDKESYYDARDKYVDGHRFVVQRQEVMDRAFKDLDSKRVAVRGDMITQFVNRLKSDLEVATSVATALESEVAGLKSKVEAEDVLARKESRDGIAIDLLNADIAVQERDKVKVQQKIRDYTVENKGPARVTVMGPANASDSPDQSDRIKFGLLAVLAAFTVSLGLGIAREFSDQNIRSAQDVSYVTDYPVLASIPHTSEDRIAKDANLATVAYDYPNSMTSDQYRQIVARMLHWSNSGNSIKTCAITSPLPGEGKSTLACNLAIALAQADLRVLLVDINARNPVIEKSFGLEPDIGITDMLSGDSLVRDPDRETSVPNLFVVGPGLRNADLVERLASKEMTDFIHGAERLFDNVIIDTPAALLASEAKLIAPIVGSVIMTTKASKASFGQLRRSLRSVEENGGTVMGVVVTAVKHVTGGYLRENMNMYYKHDTVSVKEKNGKSKTLSPSRTPVLSSKDRHPDEEL